MFLDGAEYGMDAFLSSYQAVSGAGITGEDLPVSGGFLLAGIVVGVFPKINLLYSFCRLTQEVCDKLEVPILRFT